MGLQRVSSQYPLILKSIKNNIMLTYNEQDMIAMRDYALLKGFKIGIKWGIVLCLVCFAFFMFTRYIISL